MNIRQLLKLLCDLSIICSTRNFFSQSPSGRQYPAASSELSGALQRVVDLSWTERNATITWKAHWRGGCKVAREKNEVTEERRSDLIRRFFVCPNFGSFFHLSVLLPPGSLFVLFFQAGKNLFFTPSFAFPSYLHTCPLTSFLTVFPPPATVSPPRLTHRRLFIRIDWYLFKTDQTFFSLLPTSYLPSSPSSSLSAVVLNHYFSACKAQKRTCPLMVCARVQALKYGCGSDTLESSAADPIYFNQYPWCLAEGLKTEALIFLEHLFFDLA